MAPTANYENDQQQQPICQKPQPTTIGSNTKLKTIISNRETEARKKEEHKGLRGSAYRLHPHNKALVAISLLYTQCQRLQ